MRSVLLKLILVFLVFFLSLALPHGLYFALVLFVGVNILVSRRFSYQLAFVSGVLLDLVGVHFGLLGSALLSLLVVKLAEIIAERLYGTDNEFLKYLLIVSCLTVLLNLVNLVYYLSLAALLRISYFVLFNLLATSLVFFVIRKFKEFYLVHEQ